MTVRPAFESPSKPAADAVVHAVAAARLRLRTVSALRLVAIAAPGGMAAGAALALLGWAPAWTPAALGALAVAGAVAWAAAQTPPASTVARILDAHLELKDRVAAALQLCQSGGPIAALVARDAAARLAAVDFAALFPLTFGRAHAASAVAAVMTVGWLAAAGIEGRRPAAPAASREATASESGEAGGRAAAASRTSEADAGQQTRGQRSEAVARDPGRAGTGVNDASRAAAADTSVRPLQAAQPPGTSVAASPVNLARGDQPPAGAPSAASASGRAGRGGSAAAGITARGGLTAGAGGVGPGNALSDAAGAGTPSQPPALSIGAARATAEAALARDVIPPDHREHVRDYFRALPAARAGTGGPP